jgi:hypothetical protein
MHLCLMVFAYVCLLLEACSPHQLRVSSRALRTVERVGGLDSYLLEYSHEKLDSDIGAHALCVNPDVIDVEVVCWHRACSYMYTYVCVCTCVCACGTHHRI